MCCGRVAGGVARETNPFCSSLETSGAGFKVWPVQTRAGTKLVSRAMVGGRAVQIDFLDFLRTSACKGSTGQWILGELPRVANLLSRNPAALTQYATHGISISDLAKLSRSY